MSAPLHNRHSCSVEGEYPIDIHEMAVQAARGADSPDIFPLHKQIDDLASAIFSQFFTMMKATGEALDERLLTARDETDRNLSDRHESTLAAIDTFGDLVAERLLEQVRQLHAWRDDVLARMERDFEHIGPQSGE